MTAACVDQELLLGGLVDGELDAANTALAEAHVARCEGCREEVERLQAVRNLLQIDGVRHSAPAALSKRIEASPQVALKAANENRVARWLAPALGGAVAASLAFVTFAPLAAPSPIDRELVSSHVRSLQPGHLTDVQTTNQHIVKPWFNGRIDFAPPVPELADRGFPLAGGRLDSIDGKTVAAIVYHRRLHTVNLYVWPSGAGGDRAFVEDGFAVREWTRNGLRFAAVSDIPAAELQQFEAVFIQRSG
ncbi:anti-sigma factor family protein [Sphingomonas sp. URHD0057]|uniref:anti-sigma factor family protein n=1 Tax=Sphingomonas sp. URHD0057 TaxID=1380389 RepID=UPI00048F21FC|nr:zf-HC2 domain-containing protein [Sphingomonas sp. URHD0057]